MSQHVQSKAVLQSDRANGAAARPVGTALESDFWVWGVIFTAAALTALCLAMLFCVGIG